MQAFYIIECKFCKFLKFQVMGNCTTNYFVGLFENLRSQKIVYYYHECATFERQKNSN